MLTIFVDRRFISTNPNWGNTAVPQNGWNAATTLAASLGNVVLPQNDWSAATTFARNERDGAKTTTAADAWMDAVADTGSNKQEDPFHWDWSYW